MIGRVTVVRAAALGQPPNTVVYPQTPKHCCCVPPNTDVVYPQTPNTQTLLLCTPKPPTPKHCCCVPPNPKHPNTIVVYPQTPKPPNSVVVYPQTPNTQTLLLCTPKPPNPQTLLLCTPKPQTPKHCCCVPPNTVVVYPHPKQPAPLCAPPRVWVPSVATHWVQEGLLMSAQQHARGQAHCRASRRSHTHLVSITCNQDLVTPQCCRPNPTRPDPTLRGVVGSTRLPDSRSRSS